MQYTFKFLTNTLCKRETSLSWFVSVFSYLFSPPIVMLLQNGVSYRHNLCVCQDLSLEYAAQENWRALSKDAELVTDEVVRNLSD